MSNLKIMAVGAHPDDVEFAMGGTIADLSARGHEVFILDITNGEPTPHGSPEIREKESKLSASILGAKRKTLPFSNRYLFDTREVREAIAEEIRTFLPDMLFIHYPQDAHPDHWAASVASMAARFYGKLSNTEMIGKRHFTPRIYYFFSVHLRISPPPAFCTDISHTMDKKIEAILSYESQFQELYKKLSRDYGKDIKEYTKEQAIKDFIGVNNHYYGQKTGVAYAEPFYSPELLSLKHIDSFLL